MPQKGSALHMERIHLALRQLLTLQRWCYSATRSSISMRQRVLTQNLQVSFWQIGCSGHAMKLRCFLDLASDVRGEAGPHLKSSTLRRKLAMCCASTLQKLRKSCSPTKCAAAHCMAPMSSSPCCRIKYLYSRTRALNLHTRQHVGGPVIYLGS